MAATFQAPPDAPSPATKSRYTPPAGLGGAAEGMSADGAGGAGGAGIATPLDPGNKVSTNTPPPIPKLPNLSPEIESQLANAVRIMFQRARHKRREITRQWDANYKACFRRQWSQQRASHLPVPSVSEIFATVDTLVGWVTDQQPTFDCTPALQPGNPWFAMVSQLANDLKYTIRASWQVDKTDAEMEKLAWNGFLYGIGFTKTVWDGSASSGFGNARVTSIDPYTLYVDPEASDMESANYFIEARTISMQELERRFPGATNRLGGHGWNEQTDNSITKYDAAMAGVSGKAISNPGALAPATIPNYGPPGGTGNTPDVTEDPGVTVFEAWLRTPIHSKEGDRVYDGWRCVVIAGNKVLMDKMGQELWSHGQHPYDRYTTTETGEFYGPSLVEILIPIQRSINYLLAAIENNIWLMGNPVLKEDVRAGVSRTLITNKPGARIPTNNGGTVAWMEPPQIAPGMAMQLIQFLTGEMERISGLSAVVRGASPTGRNAQGVIDSVQEAAFVRLRKNIRNMSRCIGSGGEKMASMIVEFYDAPRMVTYMGPSGESTALYLRSQHFYLPSDEGRVPMRYQLLIDAGEATSQSRGQRIGEADALFALGAIDEEALLEVHNFPNWQNVAKRVKADKAAAGTTGQPPTQRAAARR